ncbi:MAG TPA: outer membrane protein assembly factor BamA, partial [Hyphomonas atlantica]|nr:outer membrane protein assembly factor BamA [Hyphomonas atlantica]
MSRKTKTLALSLLLSSVAVSTIQLPALAQAEIFENTGTIERIIVNGNQRIEDRTVLSYILVEPGSSFDANRIDLSLKSLFATGLFADAKFDRVGNQLVITLVENPIVSRVMIEGNKAMA